MLKINDIIFPLLQVAKSNEVLVTGVKLYEDYIRDKSNENSAVNTEEEYYDKSK